LKVKLPFEPSSLAEAAGIAALEDREFLHRTLETNARGMNYVRSALSRLGIETASSEANFVMTVWPSPGAAGQVVDALLREGVIVRPLEPFGVPNGVRITIGSDEDNRMLVNAIESVMNRVKLRTGELALCS